MVKELVGFGFFFGTILVVLKQGQFSFFFKELGGYLNDIEGLTYPFTYVGELAWRRRSLPEFLLGSKYQLWLVY